MPRRQQPRRRRYRPPLASAGDGRVAQRACPRPPGTDPSTIAAALTVQRQREARSLFSADSLESFREAVQSERILLRPASRGLSPFRESVAGSLYVLLAIAVANVAGLLIARASTREREM